MILVRQYRALMKTASLVCLVFTAAALPGTAFAEAKRGGGAFPFPAGGPPKGAPGTATAAPGAPAKAAIAGPGEAPAAAAAKGRANREPAIDMASALRKTYEEKGRDILERYVPLREFQITAEVVPNGKPLPRAPYEPRAFSPGATLNMGPDELSLYVTRVSFEVLVTNRLMNSRRRIEDLLMKGLRLDAARGDRISFGALGLEPESEEWRKERNDLMQELTVMRSENERLSRELSDAKLREKANEQRERDKDKEQKSVVDQKRGLWDTDWFVPAIVGGACAILFLGLLAMGGSLYSAGKQLGGAVTAVAQSMQTIGGALSTVAGKGEGGGIQSLEAKLLSDGGGPGKGGLANLPIEAIHAHLLKVRNELLESLNDSTEAIILRHLTQLLSTPETVSRGICTLELLGRDTATELFKRLGIRSQEAVMTFLRTGVYDRSKLEMMLEAAEELKTKLLVESFDRIRGKPSEKVAQRLLQISDDELVHLAAELDAEYLPRLFLYLEPQKIAGLLSSLKRQYPDQYSRTLQTLAKLPEASVDNKYDDNIAVALESIIDKTKSDFQRPFLKVYQDIVEAADEEMSEQIVQELSHDPRIEQYFRENVITIGTFFLLAQDQRNEIIESLSNKDVAAFAFGMKEDEQELIFTSVPQRRKGLVTEEFESMTARGGRQAQYAFRRVRDLLVKRLKDMKTDGTLVTVAPKTTPTAAKAPSALPPKRKEGGEGGAPPAIKRPGGPPPMASGPKGGPPPMTGGGGPPQLDKEPKDAKKGPPRRPPPKKVA